MIHFNLYDFLSKMVPSPSTVRSITIGLNMSYEHLSANRTKVSIGILYWQCLKVLVTVNSSCRDSLFHVTPNGAIKDIIYIDQTIERPEMMSSYYLYFCEV